VEKINHVVVLMLENRSFDHLLGFLGDRFPGQKFEGLSGQESISADPRVVGAELVRVERASTADAYITSPDPGHEYQDVCLQLYGKDQIEAGSPVTNNGFVCSYGAQEIAEDERPELATAKTIMRCVDPDRVPVLSTLAQEFVVCDHWFSSVPGPTWPNRFFVHAATSGGNVDNPISSGIIRSQLWTSSYRMRTIYENLQEAGRSWKIYFHDVAQAFALRNLHPYAADGFEWFYPKAGRDTSFLLDAQEGTLPNYSFIEPQYLNAPGSPANDQHPPHDLRYGERLIATVYDALRNNEELWNKCLFVILYDEHGGFYDHISPPATVNPDGQNAENGFDFTRLGLRVPAILASPWLPRGRVDNAIYDHSSLLATVKKLFDLPQFLTERDRTANTFEGSFLTQARTDPPRNLMAKRHVAPSHVIARSDSLPLSKDQRSLEALTRALDDPGNELETSRRVETRIERALRRFEGA